MRKLSILLPLALIVAAGCSSGDGGSEPAAGPAAQGTPPPLKQPMDNTPPANAPTSR